MARFPVAAPVRRTAALALVLAVLLALAGPVAVTAQEVPPTTVPDLLVPGDPSATSVAPATTGPPPTTAAPAADDGGLLDLDLDANQKVWVIVAGLVAVALAIAVLTVIYWRHTRPGEARPSRRERRAARRGGEVPATPAPERPDGPPAAERAEGPLDIDDLLGRPEPSRSIFASPDDEAPGSR